MHTTDVLIIGSGIAGLTVAIKTAENLPDASVTLVTKKSPQDTNTVRAQGGIAIATDQEMDSPDLHARDTMEAGDERSIPEVVESVVQEGPECLQDFLRWGGTFDTLASGEWSLGREGAHTVPRVLHRKDYTGKALWEVLKQRAQDLPNIEMLDGVSVIDLEVNDSGICSGAWIINGDSKMEKVPARMTVLATGGIGQAYKFTTNSAVATGDGIAMAYRAGAMIQDMEFVQFHPTALYNPPENPAFLISEALRGEGAFLRNSVGEAFMTRYDRRGSLASRDKVSQAIAGEMAIHNAPCVYLDCSLLPGAMLHERFTSIEQYCRKLGIDITRDMIPVRPAAHYMCGGVVTDMYGRTDIENLYACGEVACTGLHGANRLASNSLLEGFVFGRRVGADLAKRLPGTIAPQTGQTEPPVLDYSAPDKQIADYLRDLMSEKAGIIREDADLAGLQYVFEHLRNELPLIRENFSAEAVELQNLMTVSKLITDASQARIENCGCFFKKNPGLVPGRDDIYQSPL